MSTPVRTPAVAGRFYPGQPESLRREINGYVHAAGEKIAALGCIVPHAGYMYSGHVAGAVYARLRLPNRFILLCPNHTGMGQPLSVVSEGAWQTPLGTVAINGGLASALKAQFPSLAEDADAHTEEHAIEVQIPFLQQLVPELSFVPIAVGTSRFDALQALGEAIAAVLTTDSEKTLIVASSDMNHYESDEITRQKDTKALQRILALDPAGLYDVVVNQNVSMCGFGPAVAMLTAAKRLGGTHAELIKYATSGDISGDRQLVVGYAGVAIS